MIGVTLARTFVYPGACDLRKGSSGLSGLVECVLAQSVKSGAVFAFVNRRRNAVKLLYWDGTGIVVVHKKLSSGRFPKVWELSRRQDGCIVLSASELSFLFEGGDIVAHRKNRDPRTRRKMK